jgi:hypothetical protein
MTRKSATAANETIIPQPPQKAKRITRATKTQDSVVAPEQRRRYIEVAAYYLAERRGFRHGDETADWLTAEAEVDHLLADSAFNA